MLVVRRDGYRLEVGSWARLVPAIVGLVLVVTLVAPVSTVAASPANDAWQDATLIPVSSLPFTDWGDNEEAGSESGEHNFICNWGVSRTVWYRLTPEEDQVFRFTLTGDFDMTMELTVGNTLPSLSLRICSDNEGNGTPEMMAYPLKAGLDYYLRIGTSSQRSGSGFGDFGLDVADHEPKHDFIEYAKAITQIPYADSGSDRLATPPRWPDWSGCRAGAYRTVWYRLEPGETVASRATLTADHDISFQVWEGNSPDQMINIACDSAEGPGVREITFERTLEPGFTYWFEIGSASKEAWGEYTFELSADAPVAAVPPSLAERAFAASWAGTGPGDASTRLTARAVDGAEEYRWDIDGDGAVDASGQEVVLPFASAGEQEVILSVTFPGGFERSATRTIAADPAATYAPLVYLHPDETRRPSSAESFIGDAVLRFAHDERCKPSTVAAAGTVDAARLGSGGYEGRVAADDDCALLPPSYRSDQLTRPHDTGNVLPDGEADEGEGFYLDIPKDRQKQVYRGTGPTGVPAYYEYEPGRYVIYWFFYPYNEHVVGKVGSRHEGDWEHITVRLDYTDRATRFAYYPHECPPMVYGRGQMEGGFGQRNTGLRSETHPIVYAALGSHASYPRRKRRWEISESCGLPAPLRLDAVQEGDIWRTWEALVDARQTGWYGYGGGWGPAGEIGIAGVRPSDGPLGPSTHKLPGAVPDGWR